ncbi:MAG: hypothetical protein JST68_12715 [Bacteroidetes bacterium]|nr:hypothetical protein [Bacteroidota bacterium]
MKRIVLLTVFLTILCSLPGYCQLSNGGVSANFGVDADTRSNWVKYGPLAGAAVADDWFSPSGSGFNVIDTSNAAALLSLVKVGTNISFNKRMSQLLYSKTSGKLWIDAVYGRDFTAASTLKDSTTFTIASKNGGDPGVWKGGVSSFPNKNDLVDVYAHMRRDGLSVHDSLWLFTGVSTYGTTGSSYFDVELYKNTFSYTASTGLFTTAGTDAGHAQWLFDASGNIVQTGDLIIAVNFSPGSVPVVDLRIWISQTTLSTITPAYFNFSGSFDGASSTPTYGYASIVSKAGTTAWGTGISNYSGSPILDTTYATPWGTGAAVGGFNWSPQYLSQQFIEVGLNLTRIGVDPALYSALSPCESLFSNLFFKSRSSNSFTANMQDFVTPLPFTRTPVMDYSLQPDTLRCNHPSGSITLTNNTTAGYYTWQTADGSITGANSDSSKLNISKSGTYIVTSSPAEGCPATRKDTIRIPIDTFPPVASAAVGLSGSNLLLYGGNLTASNYATPFGGSSGLTFTWSGPAGFSSTLQNPVTDTTWGAYQVIATERRNGCTAIASTIVDATMFAILQDENIRISGVYEEGTVNLRWENPNGKNVRTYTLERMDENRNFVPLITSTGQSYTDSRPLQGNNAYRIKAINLDGTSYYSAVLTVKAYGSQNVFLAGGYDGVQLIANMPSGCRGVLVIYNVWGQLLQKREVYLQEGSNTIYLSLNQQKTSRVIALLIGGRIIFSQKILF